MQDKFQKIREIVEKELSCSAHDMDHVDRVYNLCLHLAKGEKVDIDVLRAAVLLHDIAKSREYNDKTGTFDHATEGAKIAGGVLKKLDFPEDKIKHIKDCIISHRYKTDNKPKTLEAKILFDADKLEAVGAIGVVRAYVWIGKNNGRIYYKLDNLDEYIKNNLGGKINGKVKDRTIHSPQIELETKVKFLVDRLFTKKAKKIGRERVKYFKEFLHRLEKEIKGKI